MFVLSEVFCRVLFAGETAEEEAEGVGGGQAGACAGQLSPDYPSA